MSGARSGSDIGADRRRRIGGVPVDEVEDPRDAAEAVTSRAGHKHDDEGKDGVPHELEFDLDFTDSRGYHWRGSFKTHILSISERAQVGLTKSRLAGGLSVSVIDGETSLILEMQAHLAIALLKWPDWAEELGSIRDVNVLGAIYKEVVSHEERFWGTGPQGSS